MKIIFKNEEEKKNFFINLNYYGIECPSDICFPDSCIGGEGNVSCENCWKNAIPYKIEEPEA